MIPQEIPPPDALRDRVRASLATVAPSMGWPARFAIATVSVAVAIGVGLARMRPDLASGPSSALLALSGALALLAAATSIVGLSRGRRGLGASVIAIVALSVLTLPLYALLTMSFPLGEAPAPPKIGCFTLGIVCGLLVLAGLVAALRRSVPAAPVARGALIGACAGAWAGLALHLHCPAVVKEHLLIGHVLPLAIATMIGLIVAPRFLRP